MSRSLVELAHAGLLVCEGAMGSELVARGVTFRNSGEANLSHPEVVAAVHRDYRDAGATVFQTNTFAANQLMLERAGLGEQAAAIQTAAVRVLREAVGPEPLVALGLGPTGHLVQPFGDLSREAAVTCFARQLETMLPHEVDFVLAESFEALAEVETVVEAVGRVGCTLPLAVTVSFSNAQGTTMMGHDGATAARKLADLGVDVIGANCGHVEGLRLALEQMAEVAELPLMAQPNAGQPELVEGRTVYRQSPEEFGRFAQGLVELGVRVIGGCCGTTPAHIRQLARVARAD